MLNTAPLTKLRQGCILIRQQRRHAVSILQEDATLGFLWSSDRFFSRHSGVSD